MQLVISAFPGCGKSTLCNRAEQYGLIHCAVSHDGVIDPVDGQKLTPIFDSDSSLFDKEDFPGNYIEHIKEVLSNYPNVVIMVSSHENVRDAMKAAGIDYTLVYPARELKGLYLERYQDRGSSESFVTMMDDKWNEFIDSVEDDTIPSKLILSEGEYLVDKISEQLLQINTMDTNVSVENIPVDTINEPQPAVIAVEETGDAGVPAPVGEELNVVAPAASVADSSVEVPTVAEVEVEIKADGSVEVEPVPVVEAQEQPTGTINPEPEVIDPNIVMTALPASQFAGAIITGNESLGDFVKDSRGIPVAKWGVGGLESLDELFGEAKEELAAIVSGADEPRADLEAVVVNADDPVAVVTAIQDQDPALIIAAEGELPLVDGDNGDAIPVVAEAVIEQEGPDRLDMISAHYEMQGDIDSIEGVITHINDLEEVAGVEAVEKHTEAFVAAANLIKERYGTEVEPTVAGMESFLGTLKTGMENLLKSLKTKSKKGATKVIKGQFTEAKNSVKEYSSEAWLSEQKLINVGKAKLGIPAQFSESDSPGDVDKLIGLITSRATAALSKAIANDKARFGAGMKIVTKLKGKGKLPDSEAKVLINESLPITPEEITGTVAASGLKELKMNSVKTEVPVLTKATIAEAVAVIVKLIDDLESMSVKCEQHANTFINEADLYNSDFWNNATSVPEFGKVYEAVCEGSDEVRDVLAEYSKFISSTCDFLERWILASVK